MRSHGRKEEREGEGGREGFLRNQVPTGTVENAGDRASGVGWLSCGSGMRDREAERQREQREGGIWTTAMTAAAAAAFSGDGRCRELESGPPRETKLTAPPFNAN